MNKKGFSLIEILIYLGIISIIGVVFFRILSVSTRVQVSQVAENEVSNQTNFVMQTIQRYIRDASLVVTGNAADCELVGDGANDAGAGINQDKDCLWLRMKTPGSCSPPGGPEDPHDNLVVISMIRSGADQGAVKLQDQCDAISYLTTDKVKDPNNSLKFRKYTNYPGHDTVEVALTLNYHSENPQAQGKRIVKTAVSRVSAATFDSDLLSGADQFGGGLFDIGQAGQRWANAFIDNLDVSGTITQSSNYNAGDRGFFMVAGAPGQTCGALCTNHTGQCASGFHFVDTPPVDNAFELNPILNCSAPLVGLGGICFCY